MRTRVSMPYGGYGRGEGALGGGNTEVHTDSQAGLPLWEEKFG